jgi:tetratricopeptide (TPR) repeat protein
VAIAGAICWVGRSLWKQQRRKSSKQASDVLPDNFPFEIIPPKSKQVVKWIYGSMQADDDPLADFNIPYQQRRRNVSQQNELENILQAKRWLLILGKTGLGKTREAAELANTLNQEGWTVLKLKNHEQLEVPMRFPAERFGPQPRVLMVLDNLNQSMSLSQPRHDEKLTAQKAPLQERLQQTLEFYEQAVGTDRVRVIATARNETEPDKPGFPSQWEMLGIANYPRFWNQFEHITLEPPHTGAMVTMLNETAKVANIEAQNTQTIAKQSDPNFRNVVENITRLKSRQLILSPNTFDPTLTGTWENKYQRAIESDPNAKYIYDAIDLLQQANVRLERELVLGTAQLFVKGWRRWWLQWILPKTLDRLQATDRILQPRDGQIEAKGTTVLFEEMINPLITYLIQMANRQPSQYCEALLDASKNALWQDQLQSALNGLEAYLRLVPTSDAAWFYKGNALFNLGRYEDAIAAYDAALQIKPDYHEALNNKGVSLRNLGRYEDAIAAYDAALHLKPDDDDALYNKGNALSNLGRDEDAIAAYDAALQIKPDLHEALYNKACCYTFQGDVDSAITWLQKAIDLSPDKYREMAKTDTDFDAIRSNPRFQALLH